MRLRNLAAAAVLLALVGSLCAAATASALPGPSLPIRRQTVGHFGFNTLADPVRLLDTRSGIGAPAGKVGPGGSVTVTLAGVGGIPADADAVVMNVTADAPTTGGFLTVFPAGAMKPDTSNVNFVPGRTVANLVVMRLGAGGAVTFANALGETHILADVQAWSIDDGDFEGFAPERFLDTRTGTGVRAGKVGAGERIDVSVLGRGSGPSDPAQVAAAIVNITADQPSAPSFVTVWPSDVPMPNASSLNFTSGQTVANLVFAPVGDDGRIALFNESGATHLIGDIVGWIPASAHYRPLTPTRMLDTRTGLGGEEPLRGRDFLLLDVRDHFIFPEIVGALVLNVTAAGPTETSFLTVYRPRPGLPPNVSNLNPVAGENTANAVVVRPGSNGYVVITNERGNTDVIVDLVGYYPLNGF